MLMYIGSHNLETVREPFMYSARYPNNVEFVPLTHIEMGASFT